MPCSRYRYGSWASRCRRCCCSPSRRRGKRLIGYVKRKAVEVGEALEDFASTDLGMMMLMALELELFAIVLLV